MAIERPVRRMDPYAQQFWDFTKEQQFRLQRCSDCGKYRWPPAPACDGCLSENFEWTPVSGRGKVISWLTFRRQYFPEYPPPHHVIMVELEEGPFFIGNPVEMDPAALHDGLPVTLAWAESGDRFGEYHLPVFRPA
jgi:uncharacterized OB-fold protein